MDPKVHPIAGALVSCQVQLCFSKYSTSSMSLGGHTVCFSKYSTSSMSLGGHTVGEDDGTESVGNDVGEEVG